MSLVDIHKYFELRNVANDQDRNDPTHLIKLQKKLKGRDEATLSPFPRLDAVTGHFEAMTAIEDPQARHPAIIGMWELIGDAKVGYEKHAALLLKKAEKGEEHLTENEKQRLVVVAQGLLGIFDLERKMGKFVREGLTNRNKAQRT